MLDSTSFARPQLRQLLQCVVVLMGALVLAGCASTRSAYRFQPATQGSFSIDTPAVVSSSTTVLGSQGLASTACANLSQPTPIRQPRRRVAQVAHQQIVAVRQVLNKRPTFAHSAAQAVKKHQAKPTQAKEVGLGTTVLGVLGLVVFPLSLIGLLIWGGPVWAVLAALAALAVLIAWLDPFA